MTFLLFAGKTYYASGGWLDYRGSYESAADAILDGKALLEASEDSNSSHYLDFDWYHVVNLEEDEIVHREGIAY